MLRVRSENNEDIAAIHSVNQQAFTTSAEADLVVALREQESSFLSLVAVQDDKLVGHIAFTEFPLSPNPQEIKVFGLSPMAVSPDFQKQGVGEALVEAGLKACEEQHVDAVVVFGHPSYYPRFGFKPAGEFAMTSVLDVPDNVFMVLALNDDVWSKLEGHISLPEAFAEL
jgi:putative acetyltransferase